MLLLPPDRISGLILRLEAGETITADEVRRAETLQALDMAKFGRDYAERVAAADDELTARLTALLEAQ
jgi:hypothetical protein